MKISWLLACAIAQLLICQPAQAGREAPSPSAASADSATVARAMARLLLEPSSTNGQRAAGSAAGKASALSDALSRAERAPVDNSLDSYGFEDAKPGTLRTYPGGTLHLTIEITGDVPDQLPRRLKHPIYAGTDFTFKLAPTSYVRQMVLRAREKLLGLLKRTSRYHIELRPVVRDSDRNVLYPDIELDRFGYDPKRIPVALHLSRR